VNRDGKPTALLLPKVDEQMEGTTPAPPICIKVTVQGQNICGIELFGEIDQACISKVGGQVAILSEKQSHGCRRLGKLKRNLKNASFDVLQYRFGGSR
jgi:hypothetical protein